MSQINQTEVLGGPSFQFSAVDWTGKGVAQPGGESICYPFEVRLLNCGDLEELFALHQLILSKVPHPHVLRPDKRDFMEKNLQSRGVTFGAFCRGELISYSVVALPGPDEESPSVDLPMAGIDPARIAVYDGSGVHPSFRGNHLHAALNQMRREYAVRSGRFHLMGTVSVFNPFSLSNHLGEGFFVKGIKEKYGGMIRLIIHEDTRTKPNRIGKEEQVVTIEDVHSHFEVISGGMWGFSVSRKEESSSVRYRFFA
jgi:hypothetical protein